MRTTDAVPSAAASPERPLPLLATVAQVAAHLQCHPRTVRRWLADHRLHHVKLANKAVRVPAAEVERFLAGGVA